MKKRYKYNVILSIFLLLFMSGCNNIENQNSTEPKIEPKVENKTEVKNETEVKQKDEEVEVEEKEEDVVELEKPMIVIDPGHSSVGNPEKEAIAPNSQTTKAKDVLGATGKYTKTPEHITTVFIAKELKNELEANGYNVVMTKTEVSQSLSNIERANIGNSNNADLVVRIHADASDNTSVNGASILVPAKNEHTSEIYETSKNYGEIIINTYAEDLGLNNRGVIQRDDMTGFNWSDVPVVILEMGFLSNMEDDTFISNEQNHNKIAKSIAKGIYSCFE